MPVLFLVTVALRRTGTTLCGLTPCVSGRCVKMGHLTLFLWDDAGTIVAILAWSDTGIYRARWAPASLALIEDVLTGMTPGGAVTHPDFKIARKEEI